MKAIAYIDKEGKGFSESLPWIYIVPAGRNPEDELFMFNDKEMPKKAVLFELSPAPEEVLNITWEKIEKEKIKEIPEK